MNFFDLIFENSIFDLRKLDVYKKSLTDKNILCNIDVYILGVIFFDKK